MGLKSLQSLRGRLAAVAVASATVLGLATAGVAAAGPSADRPQPHSVQQGPLVFGHRGAAGYRPEHTLASYDLAIRLGADVIEPDLVTTKDGALVARHEPEISATTDVLAHPEFAGRRTTKLLDGVPTTGWFTEDFTLAELRTLRAKERIPDIRQHNTLYDGRFQVPTFQEVIDLAKRESRRYGREIGIAPETKHPTYFRQQGKPLEPTLIRTLTRNGLNRTGAKVWVQSFEVGNLKALRSVLRVHLVQLTSATGAPYDFVASGDPRTSPRRPGCAGSPATPTSSARTRTRSSRGTRPADCWRRPRWSATPTGPGSTLCPTPSATRTPSCRSTSAAAPTPPRTATRSPSTRCSSRWAWMGCSATMRTLRGRPGTSSSQPTATAPPPDRRIRRCPSGNDPGKRERRPCGHLGLTAATPASRATAARAPSPRGTPPLGRGR
jgi:glycerophosphoryl diester phosphodiesterase